jgi:hypothetical protein
MVHRQHPFWLPLAWFHPTMAKGYSLLRWSPFRCPSPPPRGSLFDAYLHFTASGLANVYIEAREERQVTRLENHIRRCDLIVVDELGYVPLKRNEAEYLFGFFSQCYERTSLIVTTNLPFADWPQIFADDERLAGALLDRLTHHVHILEIVGDSYRLAASKKRQNKKGGDHEKE